MPLPSGYTPFHPSDRRLREGSRLVGPADPNEKITVTIRVRRPPGAAAFPVDGTHLSRAEFGRRYAASSADLDVVMQFASAHALQVVDSSAVRRSVVLEG